VTSLRILTAAAAAALALSAPAHALVALPADGSQLNSDAAAGIDPTLPAGVVDVVGGALDATKPAVPWTVFEQTTKTGSTQRLQVFSRAFKGGAWVTEGHATVGGLPGQTVRFPASLNFDQSQDGEAPAIDFAGAGRAVPWAVWYEATTALAGKTQVFASRFDAANDRWAFAGQARTGAGGVNPPSLNVDTGQNAEDPAVAGGSTDSSKPPGPWVAWQETAPAPNGHDQIFVSRPVATSGDCPIGTKPAGGTPEGGFCWQQTGTERVAGEPSLNVDPTRDGIEPDLAFTGPSNTVPWVVWYETGGSAAERVFAAKAVSDASADGGFHWQAVGNGTAAPVADQVIGTSSTGCFASTDAQAPCALNKDASHSAEDPRVASGTMTPGGTTVPWVVWDEDVGGVKQVFVSRLVNRDHFELANTGAPLSLGANDSTRPDIAFARNTPYISWREQISTGDTRAFVGHLVDPANPTFVLDTPGGLKVSAAGLAPDERAPISSTCTVPLLSADGLTCQGAAVGSPFFVVDDGDPLAKLFGLGYQPGTPTTGGANGTSVSGSVDPLGGPVEVRFDFAGRSSTPQVLAPATADTPFSANLTGLQPGSTVTYHAVARGDFGTLIGADKTLTVPAPVPTPTPIPSPPPDVTPPHITARVHATLRGLRRSGRLKVFIKVSEPATVKVAVRLRTRTLGAAGTSIARSKTVVVRIARSALRHRRHATLKVRITASDRAGNHRTLTLTLRL
jgi:hypothetical protein